MRVVVIVAVTLALIVGGWTARGWYEGAQQLTAQKAAEAAIRAAQAKEASIAERVEQRLAALKTTERVIDRGVIREIQKPIYQRVCIDAAGIRLLNAAAAGIEPNPADATDAMPGDAADAHDRDGGRHDADDDRLGQSVP